MSPFEYAKQRQIFWARRQDIRLGGQYRNHRDPEQARRGASSFVYQLVDNLFEPLSQEAVHEYEAGDGGELRPHQNQGRMYAVNSSSALVANLFHYWRRIGQVAEIAQACQLPSVGITGLRFEANYPIDEAFTRDPNLDAVISYGRTTGLRASAIECKFLEPFNRTHPGLRHSYLEMGRLWTELPALREIAERVSPQNDHFAHLDAPQLIKHILGLKEAYGKDGFRLLYLHYGVAGRESVMHSEEIEEFAGYAHKDGIAFQSLTYQDVLLSLARAKHKPHTAYINYMMERYF